MEKEGAAVFAGSWEVFLRQRRPSELKIGERVEHTLSQGKIQASQNFHNMIPPTFPVMMGDPKNQELSLGGQAPCSTGFPC